MKKMKGMKRKLGELSYHPNPFMFFMAFMVKYPFKK
jgi:hypothetical protein